MQDEAASPATEEVAEQPVKEQEQAQPEQQEQTAEKATEEVEKEVSSETAKEEPKPKENKDSNVEELLAQYRQNEPYQFNSKDGYVDPNEVASAIEQRLLNRMQEQRQQAQAWESIEKKYPEIKEDGSLRELMLNQHIAEVVQGKKSNLQAVADSIMERVSGAKSEGRSEAKVSKKIQKAASLETATQNSGEDRSNELMERISGGDKVASQQLIKEWMDSGKI